MTALTAQAVKEERDVKLRVSDVSGQKVAYIPTVPPDATVGEVIDAARGQMKLPTHDNDGRPLVYHARLEREGRHLHASELVGDALETGDKVILQPNIDAG